MKNTKPIGMSSQKDISKRYLAQAAKSIKEQLKASFNINGFSLGEESLEDNLKSNQSTTQNIFNAFASNQAPCLAPYFYIKEESMEELLAEGLRREKEQWVNLQFSTLNVQQADEKPAKSKELVQVEFHNRRYKPTPADTMKSKFTLK